MLKEGVIIDLGGVLYSIACGLIGLFGDKTKAIFKKGLAKLTLEIHPAMDAQTPNSLHVMPYDVIDCEWVQGDTTYRL